MATRSAKGLYNPETGKVEATYTHWDGYPAGVGKTLAHHYTDLERVKELISLGDTSTLKPFLSLEEAGYAPNTEHSIDGKSAKDVCLFYGRDRGEKGVEAKELDPRKLPDEIEDHYPWIEFFYLGVPDGDKVVWYVLSLYSVDETYPTRKSKEYELVKYKWYRLTPEEIIEETPSVIE